MAQSLINGVGQSYSYKAFTSINGNGFESAPTYTSVLDLGSAKTLKQAYLHVMYLRTTNASTTAYVKLQGSTDNSTWVELGSISTSGTAYISQNETTLTSFSTAYRYYRLVCYGQSSYYYYVGGGFLIY